MKSQDGMPARPSSCGDGEADAGPSSAAEERLRVLVITKIFPNAAEPLSSPFNRQQFAALGKLCQVEVMAPIPYLPGARWLQSRKKTGPSPTIPDQELIEHLEVSHPRFPYVPKLPELTALSYAAAVLPGVVRRAAGLDVLLGSWAYPDGAVTVGLAAALGLPAVIKVHGSDVNVFSQRRGLRWWLHRTLPRADRIVAVSQALAERVVDLGVDPARATVVTNGVDRELFRPRDRKETRTLLRCRDDEAIVLYVGRLERAKGTIDLLEAFAQLVQRRPHVRLVLLGDGSARSECQTMASPLGSRAVLLGARPLAEVAAWMAACDLLVLPSWNEGSPNVIREALACGRPVVATRVGGIPEIVSSDKLGELVPPKQPTLLAAAIEHVLVLLETGSYDQAYLATTGGGSSWDESAARLHQVLREVVGDHVRKRRCP